MNCGDRRAGLLRNGCRCLDRRAQHAIQVNYRSANVDSPNNPNNPLREAGRVVFDLRGPDSAAIQQFDLSHPGQMDSSTRW